MTGAGTGYSAVEGPIDPDFKSKRSVVGSFQGIKVWGDVDAPGRLGVWGSEVTVDFDICVADGACIEACPAMFSNGLTLLDILLLKGNHL